MRLIFIRHGDPDYENDNLTEKGQKEAFLLSQRTKNWKVDDVFVSPLGRAKSTAEPCLKAWGKQAVTLDWAREFFYLIDDGAGGKRIPWDFYPSQWTSIDENFRENEWVNTPRMQEIKAQYQNVCGHLDDLLLSYGYKREGRMYRVLKREKKTIVIFCHFGISMIFLSHLLNISAQSLLHGLFLPPTSVTVLNSEERTGNEAYFRAERMGDCSHLILRGEPISPSGYFAPLMQEDFKE